MKIAVAADHAGFPLKQRALEVICTHGHEAIDLGTHSTAPVDYPDIAKLLGEELGSDDPGAEREHVQVVVLDTLMRGVAVMADRRANAAQLGRRDRCTDAAAAQQHPAIGIAALHRFADQLRDVGVVDRVGRMGSEIERLVSMRADDLERALL